MNFIPWLIAVIIITTATTSISMFLQMLASGHYLLASAIALANISLAACYCYVWTDNCQDADLYII